MGIAYPLVPDPARHPVLIQLFQHGLRVFAATAEVIAELRQRDASLLVYYLQPLPLDLGNSLLREEHPLVDADHDAGLGERDRDLRLDAELRGGGWSVGC